MTGHLPLLAAEAALSAAVVLTLFRLRHLIGMAPLYLVLGALQNLQFVFASSLRLPLASGIEAGPATAVLFPLTTFVVLLTYVEEDAAATRSFAYGLVICNLTLYALSALAGLHVDMPGVSNPLDLPRALFQQPLRIIVASSVAIVLDMVATIVVYEWLSRRLGSLFLRLWLTAVTVMAIDSVVFSTIGFVERGAYGRLLAAALAGKAIGATVYAVLVAWYVNTFERGSGPARGVQPAGDVFAWLTYRQRYEQARSQMARDALTGLYNRGYFDEVAPRQVAHADRARHQMSLVLVDVDQLKATNDRFGHRAGDDHVRFVAAELRHMVRASDAACRYGGDEFAVVLTTADAASARIFGDRLRQNIRANSAALVPPTPWAPATVSIGIATMPADGRTVDELLHVADQRLYDAKRRGGDAVVDGSTAPS